MESHFTQENIEHTRYPEEKEVKATISYIEDRKPQLLIIRSNKSYYHYMLHFNCFNLIAIPTQSTTEIPPLLREINSPFKDDDISEPLIGLYLAIPHLKLSEEGFLCIGQLTPRESKGVKMDYSIWGESIIISPFNSTKKDQTGVYICIPPHIC